MNLKKLSLLLLVSLSLSFLSGCDKYKTCNHKWIKIERAPTCTEDGFIGYECTECGERQSSGEAEKAHGHSYVTHSHKDPTCQHSGEEEKICQYCGDIKIEELAILEHDYILIEEKAVTCTEDGYKLYECSYCHERVKTDVVEATGHKFESVTIAPTCTEDGYTCDKCTVCGLEENKVNYVDKKGHHYIETVVEPTCTEQGYTLYKCEDCDDHYVENIVEPLGHDFDEVDHVVSPTCIQEGYSYHECQRCHAESEHYDITAKVEHHFEPFHSESDCTHNGESYQKCSVCGKVVDYQFEQAKGHRYYEEVHPATCTEDGYTLLKCYDCDYVEKTEIKPAFGHDFEKIVVEATCQHDGYSYDKCTCCGEESEHYDVTFDRPHHLEEVTVLPTCEHEGYSMLKCRDCDYVKMYTAEYPALGHVPYVSKHGNEPTCTEKGHTDEMTCKVCGQIIVPYQELDYYHHYSKIGVHEPSCVESGYDILKCDLCGHVENTNYTTLGYHHVDSNNDKRCDDCNAHLIYDESDLLNIRYHYSGNCVLMNDITCTSDTTIGLNDESGLLNDWMSYSNYGTAFTGTLNSNIEDGYSIKLDSLNYDTEDPIRHSVLALFYLNKGTIKNIKVQPGNTSVYLNYTFDSASTNTLKIRHGGLVLFNEGTIENVEISGNVNINIINQLSYQKSGTVNFETDVESTGLVHTNAKSGIIKNCKSIYILNYKANYDIKNTAKTDDIMFIYNSKDLLSNKSYFKYAPIVLYNYGTVEQVNCVMKCSVETSDTQTVAETNQVLSNGYLDGGYGNTSNYIYLEINSFTRQNIGKIRDCYCNKLNTHYWKHDYKYAKVSYKQNERYSHKVEVVGQYHYDVEDEGSIIPLIEI